jgi:hypothetical protein
MHDPIRRNVDFTDDATDAARDSGCTSEEMATQPPRSMTSARAIGRGGGDSDCVEEEDEGVGVGVEVEDRVAGSSSGVDEMLGEGHDGTGEIDVSASSESVDDHEENRDNGSPYSNICV